MDRTDWHLLECFRVAGRLQHVTRAAEQLGTSQPALSRSLARLQSDLGVQLFRRAGRSIRLTKPGELFLSRVERALGEIDNGRRELADFKAADQGTVSLGFCARRHIPELVRRFSLVPGRAFAFVQNNSAPSSAARTRALDLICGASGHADFGWTTSVISSWFPLSRGHDWPAVGTWCTMWPATVQPFKLGTRS
jgi:DNA-binding transcriptional LysR family regulator